MFSGGFTLDNLAEVAWWLMGIIYNNFYQKTCDLWNLAHQLDKPRRSDVTWTTGLVQGRSDFLDLQTQFLALAASIIITEPQVPEIICAWDSPSSHIHLPKTRRGTGFPEAVYDCIKPKHFICKHNRDLFDGFVMETQYVSVLRAWLSVNAWPPGLGRGYRSKWGGLRYVITPKAILSDADSICLKPCVNYLMDLAKTDPNVFCWTTWIEEEKINVGLCLFDMAKLNTMFFPLLSRIWWSTDHKDSTFVQTVRKAYPEYADALKLGLASKKTVNAERFATARKYGKIWNEDVAHYHAFKAEFRRGGQKALDAYDGMLSGLTESAKLQLAVRKYE